VQWFALRVKSHFEKAVASAAHQKGFEEFLPLYRNDQRWSDRSKSVELPVFPGYVFCRLEPEQRFPLLTIPGVLHMIGLGKNPVPIEDTEIAAIRSVVRHRLRVEPWPLVEAGKQVRLGSGPLGGIKGFLIEDKNPHRIVVNLPALKRAVAVNIQDDWLAD
jgi:transcription antitermination factor NusG